MPAANYIPQYIFEICMLFIHFDWLKLDYQYLVDAFHLFTQWHYSDPKECR